MVADAKVGKAGKVPQGKRGEDAGKSDAMSDISYDLESTRSKVVRLVRQDTQGEVGRVGLLVGDGLGGDGSGPKMPLWAQYQP